MKKHNLLMLLLLMITPCLMAQKNEISQARSSIKSGRDLEKVEELMKGVLKNYPDYKDKDRVYLLWYQAVKKQYEAGNEKLYLKQSYDTAKMYNQTKRMFDVLMALDSIDAKPLKNGKVKSKYRKKHAEELNVYRPNLYYGGSFFLRKNDYKSAYELFECYLETAEHPMFKDYNYYDSDKLLVNAAYWATYSAYMQNEPEKTLKRSMLAMGDTAKALYVLQYMAEAYKTMGDDDNYLVVLNQGFEKSPAFSYFFPRLMDYYNTNAQLDNALKLTDKALEFDDKNILFLYAKSMTLFNMERYAECIKVCDRLIELNDTVPQAYYNAGMSYLRQLLVLEQNLQNKGKIRELCEKALPYMEKYRMLLPDEKKKWGMPLYRIYLNLNMGKKFEEIDKLLNKK